MGTKLDKAQTFTFLQNNSYHYIMMEIYCLARVLTLKRERSEFLLLLFCKLNLGMGFWMLLNCSLLFYFIQNRFRRILNTTNNALINF